MNDGTRVVHLLGRVCAEVARGESACDALEEYLDDPGYMREMRDAFEEVIGDAPPIGARWGVVAGGAVWTADHVRFTLGQHEVVARSVKFFGKSKPAWDSSLFVVQAELPHRKLEAHVFYCRQEGHWLAWKVPGDVIGMDGDSVLYAEKLSETATAIKVFRRYSGESYLLFTLEHFQRSWLGKGWVAASCALSDGKSRLHIRTSDGRNISTDVRGEVKDVICRHHGGQESWFAVVSANDDHDRWTFAREHQQIAVVTLLARGDARVVDAQWDGSSWWYMVYRSFGTHLWREDKKMYLATPGVTSFALCGEYLVTRYYSGVNTCGLAIQCREDGRNRQCWASSDSMEPGARLYAFFEGVAVQIDVPKEGRGEVTVRTVYTPGVSEKIVWYRVNREYTALLIRKEGERDEVRFFPLGDDPCPSPLVTTEGEIDMTTIVIGLSAKGTLKAYAQVKLPSGHYVVRGVRRCGGSYRGMRGPWLEDGYPVFVAAGRVKTVRVRWPFP